MPTHDYGWWSLAPPLLAIGLAVATRRVLISLLSGVALAAFILAGWLPGPALVGLTKTHLWGALADSGHLRVIAFTLAMGAMVGVIHRGGGMQSLVNLLLPMAKGRRGGQLAVWLMGLVIFFDDYANTLLLGSTMRPLCDRLQISREKLAYLVDSTAAPVAGLALISTWVASEIAYIGTGMQALEFTGEASGMSVFIATIPYRFYVLWALAFVPLVAVLRRDFGPMLTAERRAVASHANGSQATKLAAHVEPPVAHWSLAVVPIAITVVVVIGLLWVTGLANLGEAAAGASWIDVFNAGDSYVGLLYASLSGLAVALAMTAIAGQLAWGEILRSVLGGVKTTLPALAILWLAWALASTTSEDYLNTGGFLGGLMKSHVSPLWLPTIVFVLASGISFATGTSWGTMALLVPLVIETTHALLSGESGALSAENPIFLAAVGSVLAGAIFGDHCSPISDTTVLSSQSSGCDHIAHVHTQMPYALVVGGVSIVCGTLPVAAGVPVWVLLPLGLVVLATVLRCAGSRAEA